MSAPSAAPSAVASVEDRATRLSNSLSSLIGLGISPASIMSLLGWWDWWHGKPGLHTNLWFLIPITLLALTATLVQMFGTIRSPPFKQAIAGLQAQERKISGLIAMGVLVPTVASGLDLFAGDDKAVAFQVNGHPIATAGISASIHVLLAYLVMGLSWTISQTIEYLVFLSPFALLDWVLLSIRGALLSLLGGVCLITAAWPAAGLVILGLLLVVFLIIGGWCLRLNLFAGTFAMDLLLRRWRRPRVAEGPLVTFLGGGSGLAPARVRCTMSREGDRVVLTWRRYFIGPRRQAELDAPSSRLVRGVIWHEMETCRSRSETFGISRSFWIWLPPRYRVHDQAIADAFQIRSEDGAVLKGWAGVKRFFRNLMPVRKGLAVAAPSKGA